jgi:hypothetical protein
MGKGYLVPWILMISLKGPKFYCKHAYFPCKNNFPTYPIVRIKILQEMSWCREIVDTINGKSQYHRSQDTREVRCRAVGIGGQARVLPVQAPAHITCEI